MYYSIHSCKTSKTVCKLSMNMNMRSLKFRKIVIFTENYDFFVIKTYALSNNYFNRNFIWRKHKSYYFISECKIWSISKLINLVITLKMVCFMTIYIIFIYDLWKSTWLKIIMHYCKININGVINMLPL